MELTYDQQRFTVTEVASADLQEPILKSCAWQNYATMSKLTREIEQEKSPAFHPLMLKTNIVYIAASALRSEKPSEIRH